ncbi:MAG: hypothetical protein SGBAC_013588, partial [Bacillariaceae sp.]
MAVSYISLTMSIGLMVDFLLHILLRYFESKETTREAKVKDLLRTMGTSILIGGFFHFLRFSTVGLCQQQHLLYDIRLLPRLGDYWDDAWSDTTSSDTQF